MQSNTIIRGVKGIGLALLMMFGIMAFSSVEANAQRRDRNDRWERNGGIFGRIFGGGNNNNFRNIARQEGYRDGMDVGSEQARDRRRYDPGSSSRYRNATNGYQGWMRDREGYRNAYRRAFEQGYRDGYGRYGRGNNRRGGNWGW